MEHWEEKMRRELQQKEAALRRVTAEADSLRADNMRLRAAAAGASAGAELEAYRDAAQYDAMMEGPRFKGWDRSQLDRARRMTEAARSAGADARADDDPVGFRDFTSKT